MKRRQKREMGYDAYKHYKWYMKMLKTELYAFDAYARLKIIHWNIESANREAFIVNGTVFNCVSIIIGPEVEHWYCANVGRNSSNIHGDRNRKPNSHYHNPIEALTLQLSNISLKQSPPKTKHECSRQNYYKCTLDSCVNNCNRCKKYVSPFNRTPRKIKCGCYIEKKFDKIMEEDESDFLFDKRDDVGINSYKFPLQNKKCKRYNISLALTDIEEESVV